MPRKTKLQKEAEARQEYEDRKVITELGSVEFADHRAKEYMEIVRKRIASTGMGITVVGPNMTLRFASPHNSQHLICVSFQVSSITDSAVFELMDNK